MNNKKKQTVAVAMATALAVCAMISPVTVHAQEAKPQDNTPVSEHGLPASEQPQKPGTSGLQSGTPAIKPKSNGEFTNKEEANQAITTALDSYPMSNETTQEELQDFLNREFVDTGKLQSISVLDWDKTEATSDSAGSLKIIVNFWLTNDPASTTYVYTFVIPRLPQAGEVAINEANFPDPIFRKYVKDNFDTVSDGVLSQDEILKVTVISIINNSNVKSLKGIEHFTALTNLNCHNTGITELDVSNNSALQTLYCYNTGISSLDVSSNSVLAILYCANTPLAWLNLGNISPAGGRRIDMPSPSVIDLTVTSDSFDIAQAFAGIDSSKIQITDGAILNGDIITGYTVGTAITYTYDCGINDGIPVTLHVALNLHRSDSDIQITGNLDTTYTGKPIDNPSIKIKGSKGAVTFTYEKWTGTGWEVVNDMPTDAGKYRIQAQLAGDAYHNEAVSEKKEFTILPKDIKNGNITVSDLNSDNDIKKLSVKDDDRELVKGTDYDVETKKVGNKTIVTIAFKGNYTGTIERTYTVETSQPEKPEQKPQQGNPQEKPKDTGSVKTGDSTKTGLLATLSMMSAGCIALLAGKKRKKNVKEDETTPF